MYARLEDALNLALELSPLDKVRLMEQVASTLERDLAHVEAAPLPSLYGTFADLGDAPSPEEIDDLRHEMWQNFPREDIG
jgi:hypothetical protein